MVPVSISFCLLSLSNSSANFLSHWVTLEGSGRHGVYLFVSIRRSLHYITYQVSVKKKCNSFGKDIEKIILNTGMNINLLSSFPLLSKYGFSFIFCSQVMNYFMYFMCVLNYNETRYYDSKQCKVNLLVCITKILYRFHHISFLFLFLSSFPSHYRMISMLFKRDHCFYQTRKFLPLTSNFCFFRSYLFSKSCKDGWEGESLARSSGSVMIYLDCQISVSLRGRIHCHFKYNHGSSWWESSRSACWEGCWNWLSGFIHFQPCISPLLLNVCLTLHQPLGRRSVSRVTTPNTI